jgi:hypothetical protein
MSELGLFSLIELVYHCELSVFLPDEFLCENELLHEQPFELGQNQIIIVIISEIIEEGVLAFNIPSQQERDADQESFFQDFIIVYFLNVLANELDAADINQ